MAKWSMEEWKPAKDKHGYYPLSTAYDGRPILMNKENLMK